MLFKKKKKTKSATTVDKVEEEVKEVKSKDKDRSEFIRTEFKKLNSEISDLNYKIRNNVAELDRVNHALEDLIKLTEETDLDDE
jgi:gas vesicle protein